MTRRTLALWAALMPFAATAQDVPDAVTAWQADRTAIFDAADIAIDDFHWIARAIVVFADSPNDPQFQQQMDLITARIEELAERDAIVITDTDPDARSALRLDLRPRGFMLVLVGKDGETKLRKPAPWDVREITRSIDKMPLRQQEVRDRRGTSG